MEINTIEKQNELCERNLVLMITLDTLISVDVINDVGTEGIPGRKNVIKYEEEEGRQNGEHLKGHKTIEIH